MRSTGFADRRRQQVDVLRPAGALPRRDEQPAALLDVSRSRRASAGADDDVVQHDRRAAAQIVIRQRLGLARDRLESRRLADRPARAPDTDRSAVPRSTTVTRTGSVGEMTKLNVLSAASASSATASRCAFMLRAPTVTGSNVTDAEPPGSSCTGLVAVLDAVDLERRCVLPLTGRSVDS